MALQMWYNMTLSLQIDFTELFSSKILLKSRFFFRTLFLNLNFVSIIAINQPYTVVKWKQQMQKLEKVFKCFRLQLVENCFSRQDCN